MAPEGGMEHRESGSSPLLASDSNEITAGNATQNNSVSNSNINSDINSNSNINSNINSSNHSNTDVDNDDSDIDNQINIDESQQRKGTLSSACFNILSTMVGGGSLSLPLAFHQAGNGLFAPFLLILIAFLVEYSIYFLVSASQLSVLKHHKSSDHVGNMSAGMGTSDDTSGKSSSIRKGTVSFESVASAAFGPSAKYFSMGLVSTICFFTIVGYGVLLRDMLLPLSDTIFPVDEKANNDNGNANDGPTLAHNLTLLFVILIVTPLCTLRNLSTLESVGAASMISIFSVACIISYRSIECNFSSEFDDVRKMPWNEYISYFPSSSTPNEGEETKTAWDNVLNALPILISVFMCHFNVLPVHNELSNPTPKRVNSLFRITLWGACAFYTMIGFVGSMYGNCTTSGVVQGNVLLSFHEDDMLLLIGRVCLSLTITFAFPILVVPARDTFLRGVDDLLEWRKKKGVEREYYNSDAAKAEYRLGDDDDSNDNDNNLSEPLLLHNVEGDASVGEENNYDFEQEENEYALSDEDINETTQNEGENEHQSACRSKERRDSIWRIVTSTSILWTGAGVACCVKDIDVVWDFLGGSLSLIMGFLIPSGSFLVLSAYFARKLSHRNTDEEMDEFIVVEAIEENTPPRLDKIMACILFVLFIPIMFILTGNAVYNLGDSDS